MVKKAPEKPETLVILVDPEDRPLGTMEKMAAHREGRLHRAFSVFVVNGAGELLLQRRAEGKYHSGGLWTNTCCSHPLPDETIEAAGRRRLREEMGLECALREAFAFVYRAELDHGLIEHELDHVLIGRSDAVPEVDPSEVSQWQYRSLPAIRDDLRAHPEHYTAWFRLCFERAAGAMAAAIASRGA